MCGNENPKIAKSLIKLYNQLLFFNNLVFNQVRNNIAIVCKRTTIILKQFKTFPYYANRAMCAFECNKEEE